MLPSTAILRSPIAHAGLVMRVSLRSPGAWTLAIVVGAAIIGNGLLRSDVIPGERDPYVAETPVANGDDESPLAAMKVRPATDAEMRELLERLRTGSGAAGPWEAAIDLAIERAAPPKDGQAAPRKADHIPLRLQADDAHTWRIEGTTRGSDLTIERHEDRLAAILPGQGRGYATGPSRAGGAEAGTPLELPRSWLEPAFLLGIDDAKNLAWFHAQCTRGRMRGCSAGVDRNTGQVREIIASVLVDSGKGLVPVTITQRIAPLIAIPGARPLEPLVTEAEDLPERPMSQDALFLSPGESQRRSEPDSAEVPGHGHAHGHEQRGH